MKLSNNYRIGLLVAFFFLASFTVQAAAHYQTEIPPKTDFQEVFKQKKASVQNYIFNLSSKKIKKENTDDKRTRNNAITSLILGLGSSLLLIWAIAAIGTTGFGIIITLTVLAAILGCIFSILLLDDEKSDDPKIDLLSMAALLVSLLVSFPSIFTSLLLFLLFE